MYEKQFLDLCQDCVADIDQFERLLRLGVDPDVSDKVNGQYSSIFILMLMTV